MPDSYGWWVDAVSINWKVAPGSYSATAGIVNVGDTVDFRASFHIVDGSQNIITVGDIDLELEIGGVWTILSTFANVSPGYTWGGADIVPEWRETSYPISSWPTTYLPARAKLTWVDGVHYSDVLGLQVYSSGVQIPSPQVVADVEARALVAGVEARVADAPAQDLAATAAARPRTTDAAVEARVLTVGV